MYFFVYKYMYVYKYKYIYIYIFGTPPKKSTFFMGKGGTIYIIFDVLEVLDFVLEGEELI